MRIVDNDEVNYANYCRTVLLEFFKKIKQTKQRRNKKKRLNTCVKASYGTRF